MQSEDANKSLADPGVAELASGSQEPADAQGAVSAAWRCFHCDETFTDPKCAAEHFGRFEDCDPICTVGAARYRDLEDQLADYRSESDAASKAFYDMGARHAERERRAEEAGYERGLRDAGYALSRSAILANVRPRSRAEVARAIDRAGMTGNTITAASPSPGRPS